MIPARYQIHRQMLNYLQYILTQPSNSLMARVFVAQQNTPTKGDWVSETKKNSIKLRIDLTYSEIKNIEKSKFHNIKKEMTEDLAFQNLKSKQVNGKKGRTIVYEDKLKWQNICGQTIFGILKNKD